MKLETPRTTSRGGRIALLAALLVALPTAAQAQRKSPLADAVAVRNRVEYRAKRAEVGAAVATTLNQDFYHAVMAQVRAGFHFNDWFSLGAVVGLNMTPNFKTGFTEELLKVLNDSQTPGDKAPTKQQALDAMNRINQSIAVQLEVTPFTGKYNMFGKLPFAYDFYGYIGPGFLNVSATAQPCQDPGVNMPDSCAIKGFRPGLNVGIGMHTFFNQWFAVNAELRDIIILNNPAGRDVNGDRNADKDDTTFDGNYMLSLGLVVFLPTSASITF